MLSGFAYSGLWLSLLYLRLFPSSRAYILLKPLSVTTNVVGLQTDDTDHVDQNSSAHVARVVGLQTDAVVVTETHFKGFEIYVIYEVF